MLDERLKDELQDVVHYCKLAREASSEHDRRILSDIAKDEYSHAKHIANILREHKEYKEPTEEWEMATKALHTLW